MRFLRTVAFLVFIAIAGFPDYTWAASRNCTAAEKATANKALTLSTADRQKAIDSHLPWGVPESTINADKEMLLVQMDYVIEYDQALLIPIWTAHRLDAKKLKTMDRVNCFRSDPRIKPVTSGPAPSDYVEPIFDQGHLTPNGDMAITINAVVNSFVMTNMTPQFCQFNRGVWEIFETLVRTWAGSRGTIYVTTGSVFDRDGDGKRDSDADLRRIQSDNGKSRVAIPSHFYKILIHQQNDGTVESLAVLVPNDQTQLDKAEAVSYLESHIVSIADIEAVTGLKFFPNVAAADAAFKQVRTSALWPFTGQPPHSAPISASCKATAGYQF